MTSDPQSQPRSAGRVLGAMWVYSLLRILLFLVLFGLLWLVGVKGLLGALIAAIISIPLSFVLLAGPRHAFAARVEQNLQHKAENREQRAAELDSGEEH